MGLDKALDQFCRDHLDQFLSPDKSTTGGASPSHAPEEPSDQGNTPELLWGLAHRLGETQTTYPWRPRSK